MPRQKQSEHDISSPVATPLPHVPERWPELEKWEKATYDGIKGFPPEWVPSPFQRKFYSARSLLLITVEQNKATYAEIRSRFDDLVEKKHHAIVLAIMKDTKPYDDSLHFLVDLYEKVRLGPIDGLKLLAGDAAVAGMRVRTGYTKRSDFRDRPRVQQIGKDKWAVTPNLTIKDIINSPELEPFRYTKKTLREWLSKIDPRQSTNKRGRPRSRK